MPDLLDKEAKTQLLGVLRERYRLASKEEKSKVLDEFVTVAGCHRKHAIRLFTAAPSANSSTPLVARRTYDEAVRQALLVLWEAADRICGKRLQVLLPSLVTALEQHGHLDLDPIVRQRLLTASAATIDRLLAPMRSGTSRRKKRKTKTKPSKQVPVRTFADWKDPLTGYLEIDFVSHGGSSVQGAFLWTLAATDVCTGWTETIPLVAREQSLVVEGLTVLRRQFPMPIRGIDSDNDSAFLNETLIAYCQRESLEFTRSRAYQKNDQAWIEQQNGAVVRRFVGDERYAGLVAGQCLAQLYQAVRLFVNYFQPSFKLRTKVREGAKVKKYYHKPATPCERLLAHTSVTEAIKERVTSEQNGLDPLALLQRIRASQKALASLSAGTPAAGPEQESLQEFLGSLPELWKQGEARPTHQPTKGPQRWWRTRSDPFESVWGEILLWLQAEPEATAKVLLERLEKKYPGRFPQGQLRTLQRRIRDWRRVMARELVGVCLEGEKAAEQPIVVGATKENGTGKAG